MIGKKVAFRGVLCVTYVDGSEEYFGTNLVVVLLYNLEVRNMIHQFLHVCFCTNIANTLCLIHRSKNPTTGLKDRCHQIIKFL